MHAATLVASLPGATLDSRRRMGQLVVLSLGVVALGPLLGLGLLRHSRGLLPLVIENEGGGQVSVVPSTSLALLLLLTGQHQIHTTGGSSLSTAP